MGMLGFMTILVYQTVIVCPDETYLHRSLALSKNPRMERIFQTKLYLYDIPYLISNFPTKMKL